MEHKPCIENTRSNIHVQFDNRNWRPCSSIVVSLPVHTHSLTRYASVCGIFLKGRRRIVVSIFLLFVHDALQIQAMSCRCGPLCMICVSTYVWSLFSNQVWLLSSKRKLEKNLKYLRQGLDSAKPSSQPIINYNAAEVELAHAGTRKSVIDSYIHNICCLNWDVIWISKRSELCKTSSILKILRNGSIGCQRLP